MDDQRPIAVVTGAGRGIGRVIAERLSGSHRVVAIGRTGTDLDSLAARTGATTIPLDVSDRAAVEGAWLRIEAEHGIPQLLINNAGTAGPSGQTVDVDPTDWWRVFEVNVFGTFMLSRLAATSMKGHGSGRIVNLSSNAAFFRVWDGNDGAMNSAYLASKSAVIRFTEALAGELVGSGVTAFAISPGTVKTEMTASVFADEWDDPTIWSPPELTADLIALIATGELDGLSGRYLHAKDDDWRTMSRRTVKIGEGDHHVLRLRLP